MDDGAEDKNQAERVPTAPSSVAAPESPQIASYVYPVRSLLAGIQSSTIQAPLSPPSSLSSDNVQQFTTDILGRGPSKSSQVQSWTRDVNDASHNIRGPRRGSFSGRRQDSINAIPESSSGDVPRPKRAMSSSGDVLSGQSRHASRPSEPLLAFQRFSVDNTSPTPAPKNSTPPAPVLPLMSYRSPAVDPSSQSSESGQYDSASEMLEPFNLSELNLVHLPPLPSSNDTASSRHSREPRSSGLITPLSTRPALSRPSSTQGSTLPVEPRSESTDPLTVQQLAPTPEEQITPPVEVDRPALTRTRSNESAEYLVSHRFEHRVDENGNHVVVGREGVLTRCEDEPIRIPGAVQGFGVLIVVDEDEEKQTLAVRQVSENCNDVLGFSPKYLFSLECFTEVLSDEQADHLWDNIQFLSEPEYNAEEEEDSPHVFLLSGYGAPGSAMDNDGEDDSKRSWTCWCAVHRPPSVDQATGPNYIIMEFELERDTVNPLYPPVPVETASSSSPMSIGSVGSSGGSSGENISSEGRGSSAGGSDRTLVSNGASGDVSTIVPSSTLVSAGSSVATLTPDAPAISPEPTDPYMPVSSTSQIPTDPWSNAPTSLRGLVGDETWTPSPEDILESTTSYSKPLSALERLRRMSQPPTSPTTETLPSRARRRGRRRGPNANQNPVGMMDVFAVMAQINEQLGAATQLDEFLKITVGVIKDLTQFHRVLVYQFDEVWNGQVVAELMDWSQTHDLYKGLHFPAADIPAQARQLYAINKVRLLYDRSQVASRLVARDRKDLDNPLDMTHCFLRAMSPIHIKYLGNMGVRASMSISIMAFGALWGLVTCHSYGDHGMRVSFPVRQMLRLLSQSISRNIERLSYARRLHTRKLINTMTTDHHPTGYIVSTADDLLGLFDADFGILVIGEGAKILGPNVHGQEVLLVSEYLRLKRFNNIQASQALAADYPDLHISHGFEAIAGLLYVPLSQGGQDFIAFLRKSQPREVHWAGKPFKNQGQEARLEPRKSFKIWSETVAGRCRAWTDEQLETAGVLALVYGKFIEVWRQKETALQTTKLTNLLLSNASHEVRTPLNHIINYLEMALSGSLDGETRENLSRSHAASKSLLFTINDLLDLTRLESGNETSFNEPFDLPAAIKDAVHVYRNEAERRNLNFLVDVSNAPQVVVGDSKKIRNVVQNLTANALKYTTSGYISVCCMTFGEPEGLRDSSQTAVEIVVADTGCGIPPSKLESIFREFEQVESSSTASNEQSSTSGVGLGLAVVARIVEQLGGQLRVDSKVDEGSRFSFLIPLALPEGTGHDLVVSRSPSASSLSQGRDSSALGSNRSSKSKFIVEKLRTQSTTSQGSSGPSEVDNFVEALRTNHMSSPSAPASIHQSKAPVTSSPRQSGPGSFDVAGSGTPLRPIRVDEFELDPKPPSLTSSPTIRDQPPPGFKLTLPEEARHGLIASAPSADPVKLRILIVEDNDINRMILAKRLRSEGHSVVNTLNGQEGYDMVKCDQEFDCVLMDIQMPILNGFESTQAIRAFELDTGVCTNRLSRSLNGRIPVFAVSASLIEPKRQELWDYGIDGWILKPIDFKRLNVILQGVTNPHQRSKDLYKPGCNWEDGGWLFPPYKAPSKPTEATAAPAPAATPTEPAAPAA